MKFIVIIPTYNEKENIKRTILALESVFKQIPQHKMGILVVDDSSPDGTANEIAVLQRDFENIHLLVRKKKEGLGVAYNHAMNEAFAKYGADAVITFDADLSHDPQKIPDMVKEAESGAKYVCGTRYRKGGGIPKEWGIHRKVLSYGGNLFVRALYFGSGVSDFTSGYKLISKDVYNKIKTRIHGHKGYAFSIALNLEAVREGYKPHEIPYVFKDRTKGKSKMSGEYIINGFAFVVRRRVLDFIASRFGKVVIAGAGGATAQLLIYGVLLYPLIEQKNVFSLPSTTQVHDFTVYSRFLISQFIAIEVGVITAFSINNLWAFKDKKLTGLKFLVGLIKNNLVVIGAIAIQLIVAQILAIILGVGLLRNYVYQVIGILVGLFWNFYFYKKFIWKVKR